MGRRSDGRRRRSERRFDRALLALMCVVSSAYAAYAVGGVAIAMLFVPPSTARVMVMAVSCVAAVCAVAPMFWFWLRSR